MKSNNQTSKPPHVRLSPQVPITATNTHQMEQYSHQLVVQSQSRFDSELVKVSRTSKIRSAPPHVSAQAAPLFVEKQNEEGERPKTCLLKEKSRLKEREADQISNASSSQPTYLNSDHTKEKSKASDADSGNEKEEKKKDLFDPSLRKPLSEEFPNLSAEEVQTKLEDIWNCVSMTLLTRSQFQSQHERVLAWLNESGHQSPITSKPIVDIT